MGTNQNNFPDERAIHMTWKAFLIGPKGFQDCLERGISQKSFAFQIFRLELKGLG